MQPVSQEDLDNRFGYHAPRPGTDDVGRHEAIRAKCRVLAQMIVDNTPPSREQSLAITKLEEAGFWANAAIARHKEDCA